MSLRDRRTVCRRPTPPMSTSVAMGIMPPRSKKRGQSARLQRPYSPLRKSAGVASGPNAYAEDDRTDNLIKSWRNSKGPSSGKRSVSARQRSVTKGMPLSGSDRPPCRQKGSFPMHLANMLDFRKKKAFGITAHPSPTTTESSDKIPITLSAPEDASCRPPSRHRPPNESLFLELPKSSSGVPQSRGSTAADDMMVTNFEWADEQRHRSGSADVGPRDRSTQ